MRFRYGVTRGFIASISQWPRLLMPPHLASSCNLALEVYVLTNQNLLGELTLIHHTRTGLWREQHFVKKKGRNEEGDVEATTTNCLMTDSSRQKSESRCRIIIGSYIKNKGSHCVSEASILLY